MYKCLDTKSGQFVAIKKLKKSYSSLEDALGLREVQALQQLNHPHVIQLKRVDVEDSRLYIIFEHLDSDLTDFMKHIKRTENRSLTETEIKLIIK